MKKYFMFLILAYTAVIMVGCGPRGNAGYNGAVGPQGATGDTGTPGTNATPVTIVQLCTATTAYPGTYSEIAFCVGGNLYGTYSANGGFSTELPPGVYNSNGINSSCTFTISANCVVTN